MKKYVFLLLFAAITSACGGSGTGNNSKAGTPDELKTVERPKRISDLMATRGEQDRSW